MDPAAGAVLALGAIAFVAGIVTASAHPGARAWGLHLPGFLPPTARALVMGLLIAGAAAVAVGVLRAAAARGRVARSAPSAARRRPRPRAAWLLLIPAAAALWALRTRTHFLGDGAVWLSGLKAGSLLAESEPLAKSLWLGVAGLLETLRVPVDAHTVAWFPIALGLLAAPVLWGIAVEVGRGASGRLAAFVLLATLGSAQLFFGYIESYPPAAVAVLLYLWLALRRLRGAGPPLLPAAALAIAIACHLSALYLLPSLGYLLWRDPAPARARGAAALVALGGTAALLLALGTTPGDWIRAFGIAAHAARADGGAGRLEKPYAAMSLDHAADLANAILLILPVPALLLAARAASLRSRRPAPAPDAAFLGIAAAGGLLLAVGLVLPVPPAQDWDLVSLFLLPAAVLGVRCAGGTLDPRGSRTIRIGLAGLSTGALLAFVLVNADADAGIRRFRVLLGPDARITAFGRAYGFGMLSEHYEDRDDHATALGYAREALAAEPSNPRYWLKTGTALYRLDRFEEALPLLEEAVRRGPTRGDARHNLGLCHMRLGRPREALELFRAAVAIDDRRPDWRHNLGAAYMSVGRPDSAYVTWRSILGAWPGYPKTVALMRRYFGSATAPPPEPPRAPEGTP